MYFFDPAQLPWQMLGFHTAFSLLVGSFLNVLIHRLPIIIERNWKAEARALLDAGDQLTEEQELELLSRPKDSKDIYNLAWPGSHCVHCRAGIRPWHNIPIISWLWLRGRCADCGGAIHWRYPLVEATAAVAGVVCYLAFQPDYLQILAMSVFCWALIAMALTDMETGYLPDELTLTAMWLGLIYNLYGGPVPLEDAVMGAAAGYGGLWLLAQGFRLWRGMDGMGGGDMKMLAMIGAWFGWQALPFGLLVACFAMLLYAALVMISGRSARILRFGPGLSLAGFWVLYAHFHPIPWLERIYNL